MPTGTTNPASGLLYTLDPNYDFLHTVGVTECPQRIGRVLFDNTTTEQAQLIITTDDVMGVKVLGLELEGQFSGEFIDWPIPAGGAGTLWVTYECNATATFDTMMHFEFFTPTERNDAEIFLVGNIQ